MIDCEKRNQLLVNGIKLAIYEIKDDKIEEALKTLKLIIKDNDTLQINQKRL